MFEQIVSQKANEIVKSNSGALEGEDGDITAEDENIAYKARRTRLENEGKEKPKPKWHGVGELTEGEKGAWTVFCDVSYIGWNELESTICKYLLSKANGLDYSYHPCFLPLHNIGKYLLSFSLTILRDHFHHLFHPHHEIEPVNRLK